MGYDAVMKTIIFDFGNVVGFFDHQRTLQKLRPHSPLTPAQMYASVYDSPLEDQFERGELSVPEILAHLRQLWQLQCEVEVLVEAISDIFWPNPEVCELIPML